MSWLAKTADTEGRLPEGALPTRADTGRSHLRYLLVFTLVLAACTAVLWYFHDRFWYPIDDGNYAHVAERVAAGEVLNGTVQDVHAGYVNLVNAAAFRIFGVDLVSLRYPLVLAQSVQAALVFLLLGRRSLLMGAVAAVGSIALGVLQFFSPTAHWYCGVLTVASVAWMTFVPQGRRGRLVVAGLLVGGVVLFRQLSGVWVGMGILTIALWEARDGAAGSDRLFARAVAGGMLLVLLAYVVTTREPLGALMFATPPAAILAWTIGTARTSTRATIGVLMPLAAGAALAAAPLFAYHLAHASVGSWISDIAFSAAKLTTLDFFGQVWYAGAVVMGLHQLLVPVDPAAWINGVYWVLVPLLSLINGMGVMQHLRATGSMDPLIFPIMAAFYGLVSIHYQIPIYLYYSAGICLAAVLWQHSAGPRRVRLALAGVAAVLTAIAFFCHAGQSYRRSSSDILQGVRRSAILGAGLERASLKLDSEDRDAYARLVSLIRSEAPPGSTIFAVPSNAELYFLSGRRNPFRFYNTALGIQTPTDLNDVLDVLKSHPPAVITFRADDKYNTPASWRILEHVRSHYEPIGMVNGIELFRLRHASGSRP